MKLLPDSPSLVSMEEKKGKERERVEIHLGLAQLLMLRYIERCSVIRRHQELVHHSVFLDQAFHIVLGEEKEGLQVEHLNSTNFLLSIASLLSRADLYLQVFRLVVFRIVRKRAQHWLKHVQRGNSNALDTLTLPIGVEEFDSDGGHLFYVTTYANERYWLYEPENPEDLKHFEYIVYEDAANPAPRPIPISSFMQNIDENIVSLLQNLKKELEKRHLEKMNTKLSVLSSPLWEGFARFRQLQEAQTNIMDAEHASTHPLSYTTMRPLREVEPGLLSADALHEAQSLSEAGLNESHRLAVRNYLHGAMAMEYALTGVTGPKLPSESGANSKREVLRTEFNRPAAAADLIKFPESVLSFHQNTPSYRVDISSLRADYTELVCMLMGGMPVGDVLSTYTPMPSQLRRKLVKATTAQDEMVNTQREQVLRQKRMRMKLLFEWIYLRVFAAIDMAALGELADMFEEKQHQMLLKTMQADSNKTKLSAKEQRELLASILGGKKKFSFTKSTGGSSAPTTVHELRLKVLQRISAAEFIPAHIIFESEVQSETEQEMLRAHEWLQSEVYIPSPLPIFSNSLDMKCA